MPLTEAIASEIEGAYEDYRDEMQKDKAKLLGLRVIDGGKDT